MVLPPPAGPKPRHFGHVRRSVPSSVQNPTFVHLVGSANLGAPGAGAVNVVDFVDLNLQSQFLRLGILTAASTGCIRPPGNTPIGLGQCTRRRHSDSTTTMTLFCTRNCMDCTNVSLSMAPSVHCPALISTHSGMDACLVSS